MRVMIRDDGKKFKLIMLLLLLLRSVRLCCGCITLASGPDPQ